MKKLGILYIATGRYRIFWEQFFRSAEKFLTPEVEKHYFVFTDGIISPSETSRVHIVSQESLKWPYITLLRFQIFLKAEKDLQAMDYLLFCNANLEFVSPINSADLFSQDGIHPLTGAIHPGFHNETNKRLFSYDRNPKSKAFMDNNDGEAYYAGGLNGGSRSDFLDLVHELANRINTDLKDNIIALWHDESHINRYFYEKRDKLHALPVQYLIPEEWVRKSTIKQLLNFKQNDVYDKQKLQNWNAKIIIRDKSHWRFGGHRHLRGETNNSSSIIRLIFDKIARVNRLCITKIKNLARGCTFK